MLHYNLEICYPMYKNWEWSYLFEFEFEFTFSHFKVPSDWQGVGGGGGEEE